MLFCVSVLGLNAQNNEINLSVGIHYDVFHVAGDNGYCKPAIMAPAVKVGYNKYFSNHTFFSTGIGFHNYSLAIKIKDFGLSSENGRSPAYVYSEAYLAGSVPAYFGYKFELTEHFHLLLSMGVDAEFYFNENAGAKSGGSWDNNAYSINHKKLYNRFNLLLGNEFLMKYYSKKGFGVGVFASYRTGIFRVYECSGVLSYNNGENVYQPKFASNGTYFSTGISLSKSF